jgi:two-component system chemotaxis response regulator CheY
MDHTVLLVDDSMFARKVMVQVLTELGHHVVGEAADGMRVSELYRALRPDIVLLDIHMPERDGFDVLRELKQTAPEAKVILISSMKQLDIQARAKQAGAFSFIPKPLEKYALMRMLHEVELARLQVC